MGSKKDEPPAASANAKNNNNNAKAYGRVLLTLKNQLLPEEKLSNTPSQQDGLSPDTETDLRIYGCELIQTAGILLKLPQVAMATGQVLLQRFYYSKSLVRHPVEHVAMACVCLASKIEEAPRRVRDVINVFAHVRQVAQNRTIQPVILDQNYIHLKNLVIKAERRVLKELGFCVHIKHPHKIIVMYLQVLNFQNNKKLMQYSWNYMNDSLRTDVFVRYQPETVACACIYLTARKLRLPLPRGPAWFGIFGATEQEIRDICVRILKLYNRPKPNIEALEKKVEELCKRYQEQRAKARGGGPGSGNHTPTSQEGGGRGSGGGGGGGGGGSEGGGAQKSAGAHNAWGGFISRSGSHIPPLLSDKRSRSRSPDRSPDRKRRKRAKKRRSRSRSPPPAQQQPPAAQHKKGGGGRRRKSRSRSRSGSPQQQQQQRAGGRKRDRRRSPSAERYADRYEEKERYADRYEEKKERHDKKHDREEKHRGEGGRDRKKEKERARDRRR